MKRYNVFDCSVLELDKHHSDRKGNISVVENGKTLPFYVRRVYYLYDVPGGESRGAHAHKELSQLIVAASGSFRVTLDDGTEEIYAPTLVIVKNGKVIAFDNETAFTKGNITPDVYWDEYQSGIKYNNFKIMFQEYLKWED